LSRLRQILVIAGVVAIVVSAATWIAGARGSGLATLGIYGGLMVFLLVIERARYKRVLSVPPGEPWRETAERFVDPETSRLVVVWEHPGSGKRAYVAARAEADEHPR
jgi:hypothetical protein